MILRLSDGTYARLRLWFDVDFQGRRTTTVSLQIPLDLREGARTYFRRAVCRPPDNFSRREGRRIVAQKLLQVLRGAGFCKEDRTTVFNAICPEYVAPISEGVISIAGVDFKARVTPEQYHAVVTEMQRIQKGEVEVQRVY